MRHLLLTTLVCCGAILSLAATDPPTEKEADEQIRQSLEKITQVYHLAATHLADPVDPEKAIQEGAIPRALSGLDPFSVFLDREQFQALEQQQRGVQQGFGAVLSVQAGRVTVLQAAPGAPFARVGLGPGDRILRINGHRVASMDLQELVQVLQQARSGRVRLSVIRSGSVVPEDFDLDPTEVPSATVDKKFLLPPGVGYLHVARFEQSTPEEIRSALEEWRGQNLGGLILDLRGNPGGSLEAAVAAAGLFLPKAAVVVSLQGRAVPEREYRIETEPYAPKLPLVVILNKGTASAAEILAAALQDHDRAWLVGEASFGKGVAESVLPLSEGTALVLTTARYLTPAGRSVQRPLPGTALAGILAGGSKEFRTDRGRPLTEAGGIDPDQKAESWRLDPWAQYLEESTAFINFAQLYLERHGKIGEEFKVNEAVLEEFQRFLGESGMPIPASWQAHLPFLKARIQVELFNLVFGIPQGDGVEVEADPLVQAAGKAMQQAQELLSTERNPTGPMDGRRP